MDPLLSAKEKVSKIRFLPFAVNVMLNLPIVGPLQIKERGKSFRKRIFSSLSSLLGVFSGVYAQQDILKQGNS